MTFFLLFRALVSKWYPGPENLEKGIREINKNIAISEENHAFFVIFHWFVGVFSGGRFLILVAKVSQMRDPWDHFSRHFAAKLEKRNLCFRVHQTLLFMVSRGWVWKCWVFFFKWFSKVDPGMSFCDFL